jgi:hypothetical protein
MLSLLDALAAELIDRLLSDIAILMFQILVQSMRSQPSRRKPILRTQLAGILAIGTKTSL